MGGINLEKNMPGGIDILSEISGGQLGGGGEVEMQMDTLIPPEFLGVRPYRKIFFYASMASVVALIAVAGSAPLMKFFMFIVYLTLPINMMLDFKAQFAMRGRLHRDLIRVMGAFYFMILVMLVLFHFFVVWL